MVCDVFVLTIPISHPSEYIVCICFPFLDSETLPPPPAMPRPPLPRNLNLPRWNPPKPHLAKYHPPPPHPTTAHHFLPPTSPQLPPRRKPAFSPGGFGLQSQPAPAPAPTSAWQKGKDRERQVDEIQKKDDEIRREEERIEGKSPKEGREEAEACYVVRPAVCPRCGSPPRSPTCPASRRLQRSITSPPTLCRCSTLPRLFLRLRSPTKHGVLSTLTPQTPSSSIQDYLLLPTSLLEEMTSPRPRLPSRDGGRTLSARARVSIQTSFSSSAPMSSVAVLAAQAPALPTRLETARHDGRLGSPCLAYTT